MAAAGGAHEDIDDEAGPEICSDTELGDIDDADPRAHWEIEDDWAIAFNSDSENDSGDGAGLDLAAETGRAPVVRVTPDGRVKTFLHPDTHEKLATETYIRPTSPAMSISIRCSMHGCRVCKSLAAYPDPVFVKRWVQLGSSFPRGAEGRQAHMQLWPKT